MRVTKLMASLANVVAGATATADLNVGRTYDRLTFDLTNVAPSEMTNLKVIVDGKTIQEYPSGAALAKLNDFYGLKDQSGFLSIHFVRPEMANIAQRRHTALGTKNVQSLQISFDIDSAVTDPKISLTAVQSEPSNMGDVIKIKRFPKNASTGGEIEIDSIVKGPTIRAIHTLDTDGSNDTKPTKMEIEMNSVKVFEAKTALAQEIQKQYKRVPQDLMTHVDFTLEGDYGQALVTANAQDFRIRPTIPNAGSLDVLVEYVDGWTGI